MIQNNRYNTTITMRVFLAAAILVIFSLQIQGQSSSDMQDVVADIYRLVNNKDKTKSIYSYWLPFEFWEAITKGNPQVTEEGLRKMQDDLDGYLILAVLEIDMSTTPVIYLYGEELRAGITVETSSAVDLEQLNIFDLPHSTYLRIMSFETVVSRMFGEIGNYLEFVVFDISEHKELFNPVREGEFSVKINDLKATYSYPLGFLVPKKFCPITKTSYKGTWNYCPIHGEKLIE